MRWKLPEPPVGRGLSTLFSLSARLQMSTKHLGKKEKREKETVDVAAQATESYEFSALPSASQETTQEKVAGLRREGCGSQALPQRREAGRGPRGAGTHCTRPGAGLIHKGAITPF